MNILFIFTVAALRSKIKVMKKILPWSILISFVVLVGTALLFMIDDFSKSISYSPEIVLPKKETVSLFLVGDMMLDRGVELMIKSQGKGDYRFPFLKIADYLNKADILFGNLENIISDKGTKVGSIYSFRAEPAAIEGLAFAGFDVLSLANNHAFDYGRAALEDTFSRLKDAGISYVGAGLSGKEAFSLIIKEIKNTKIGFLAYTNLGPEVWQARDQNPGIAWIDSEDFSQIREDIEKAKKEVDVLIVSLHTGEEYEKKPSQFQIDFAKMAIDSGADLVVGHHPHVVQPNEKYKEGWIFYSLGNFIFDQSFSKETMQGLLLEVIIKNKKIAEIKQKKIQINQYFQPTID